MSHENSLMLSDVLARRCNPCVANPWTRENIPKCSATRIAKMPQDSVSLSLSPAAPFVSNVSAPISKLWWFLLASWIVIFPRNLFVSQRMKLSLTLSPDETTSGTNLPLFLEPESMYVNTFILNAPASEILSSYALMSPFIKRQWSSVRTREKGFCTRTLGFVRINLSIFLPMRDSNIDVSLGIQDQKESIFLESWDQYVSSRKLMKKLNWKSKIFRFHCVL